MDIETIRRQVTGELKAEFELKLREARHQTSLAEEELETTSEKWKAERRRLNAEIDKLEASLAETRARRKVSPEIAPPAAPPVPSVSQADLAALERLKKAETDWEKERAQLRAEISRLEGAVADLLERSNNPMRSTHVVTDRLQAELNKALESRQSLEAELAGAQRQWEEERKKLAGEVFRLKRGPGASKTTGGPENDEELQRARAETERLKRELAESRKQIETLEASLAEAKSAAKRSSKKSEETAAAIARTSALETELAAERRRFEKAGGDWERERAGLRVEAANSEAQLIESQKQNQDLEASLAEAKNAVKRSSKKAEETAEAVARAAALETETATMRERLEKTEADLGREREASRAETGRLEDARKELLQRTEETGRSAQLATVRFESQLYEATESRRKLEGEFSRAKTSWDEERQGMEAELFRLRRWASPAGREQDEGEDLRRARAEIAQLERKLAESQEQVSAEVVENLRQQYTERIQQIAQEKTRMAQDLENATVVLDRERQRFATASAPSGDNAASAANHQGAQAEAEKVRGAIAEIERLIDDPNSELTTVIRKNVERGELNAYLKGILFALGQVSSSN